MTDEKAGKKAAGTYKPAFLRIRVGLASELDGDRAAGCRKSCDVRHPLVLGHLCAAGADWVGSIVQDTVDNIDDGAVAAFSPGPDDVAVLVAGGIDVGPDTDGGRGVRGKINGVQRHVHEPLQSCV